MARPRPSAVQEPELPTGPVDLPRRHAELLGQLRRPAPAGRPDLDQLAQLGGEHGDDRHRVDAGGDGVAQHAQRLPRLPGDRGVGHPEAGRLHLAPVVDLDQPVVDDARRCRRPAGRRRRRARARRLPSASTRARTASGVALRPWRRNSLATKSLLSRSVLIVGQSMTCAFCLTSRSSTRLPRWPPECVTTRRHVVGRRGEVGGDVVVAARRTPRRGARRPPPCRRRTTTGSCARPAGRARSPRRGAGRPRGQVSCAAARRGSTSRPARRAAPRDRETRTREGRWPGSALTLPRATDDGAAVSRVDAASSHLTPCVRGVNRVDAASTGPRPAPARQSRRGLSPSSRPSWASRARTRPRAARGARRGRPCRCRRRPRRAARRPGRPSTRARRDGGAGRGGRGGGPATGRWSTPGRSAAGPSAAAAVAVPSTAPASPRSAGSATGSGGGADLVEPAQGGDDHVAVGGRPEGGQRALEEPGIPSGDHARVEDGDDPAVVGLPATSRPDALGQPQRGVGGRDGHEPVAAHPGDGLGRGPRRAGRRGAGRGCGR